MAGTCYRSAVKRRLLIAAIFLLAGAVVNLAVAWAFAAWTPLAPAQSLSIDEAGELWQRLSPAHSIERPRQIAGSEHRCWGERYASVYELREAVTWFDLVEVGERQSGVPALALRLIYVRGDVGMHPRHWYVGALGGPTKHGRFATLPLIPVWPGFVLNTLFYATLLWLLIPGPFVLRRFIRVRRGLCPACAYPRGESNVCSECGKALTGRSEAAT